jgi:sugar phosphate isomerase/epimerase
MSRIYSLAYLTSHRCTPVEAIRIAAKAGYQSVGLRLWPNAPGAPQQCLLGQPAALKETQAALRESGIVVFDLEIIRLDETFDLNRWDELFEIGAALQAKAVLVAADDREPARLCENYARLCEKIKPYGLTADLEFMPWTAVPDARSALTVIERAGHPSNAGILVDALHFGRSTTTLEDIRAIPRHLLHYAQICDAQAGLHFSTEELIHTARCARLLPGEGTIDLVSLFAALPDDLPVSVEVVNFSREASMSPQDWAALCMTQSRHFC